MTINEAILSDLAIRARNAAEEPGMGGWIDLADLVDFYGPAALVAVLELRAARQVRLVAAGNAYGLDLNKCIQGEKEIFSAVEIR